MENKLSQNGEKLSQMYSQYLQRLNMLHHLVLSGLRDRLVFSQTKSNMLFRNIDNPMLLFFIYSFDLHGSQFLFK